MNLNADVTRSLSSHLMNQLVVWRNVDGAEEGWWINPAAAGNIQHPWQFAGKVIVAEVGFALVAIVAVIETCAYIAFTLLVVLPVACVYRERPLNPFKRIVRLCESSAFTILWSVADALFYNVFFADIHSHESFTRYWVNRYVPSLHCYRVEDQIYIMNWRARHGVNNQNVMLQPIIQEADRILSGATVIRENIFATISDAAKECIRENDADEPTYQFLISKAVYLYAFGEKSNEQATFFSRTTQKSIEMLKFAMGSQSDRPVLGNNYFTPAQYAKIEEYRRVLQFKETVLEENGKIFGNTRLANREQLFQQPLSAEDAARAIEFVLFEKMPFPNDTAKRIFNEIKQIASEEQQGSLFITSCLTAAVRQQQ